MVFVFPAYVTVIAFLFNRMHERARQAIWKEQGCQSPLRHLQCSLWPSTSLRLRTSLELELLPVVLHSTGIRLEIVGIGMMKSRLAEGESFLSPAGHKHNSIFRLDLQV